MIRPFLVRVVRDRGVGMRYAGGGASQCGNMDGDSALPHQQSALIFAQWTHMSNQYTPQTV